MIVAGLDLETTGLEKDEHRIIEAYVCLWDLRSKSLIRELAIRIDPQRSIQAEASRVHRIYAKDLVGCPLFKDVAAKLRKELEAADLIVAHNGEAFDLPFLNAEFERNGFPPIAKPLVDTMLLGRHATFDGKVPNLGELCLAYDVAYDPDKAHAAAYDVDRMMQCFFRGHAWGFFPLPAPSEETLAYATAA